MKIQKPWQLGAILIALSFSLITGSDALAGETVVYTKYNIHVQDQVDRRGNHRYQASYANYTDPGTGHLIIPAGSPIVIEKKNRKQFLFLSQKNNIEVEFEFHEPRMGMSVDQYIDLITSPSPVSLSKLSKQDRHGVEEGKASIGMTKEGVLAALGYPAAHRTPSLDADEWVYWTNRFKSIAVDFENGKVRQVRR